MKRLMKALVLSVLATAGCRCVDCGRSLDADSPRISVFAHYIRDIARQRNVSLAEAADLLYGLGVRGFDAGPDDADLPELAATKLKPINFYYFPDWFNRGEKDWEKGYSDTATPAECLRLAKQYGIPRVMVVPPDFTDGKENAAEFDRILTHMRAFVAEAKALGVTVTVEDFGGTKNPCSHLKYLKRFLDEIPDLKLALDTGNLYYARRGEDVLELMAFAQGRIAHIHLKDQLPSDRRTYAELGLGGVPNAKIVKAANAAGYDGWYTLENTVAGADVYEEAVRQTAVLAVWLGESAQR